MLLRRILVALGPQRLERVDEPRPRVARIDDVVDVAAPRRDVRIARTSRGTRAIFASVAACGSPLSAISFRKRISTAPFGPITAISAVGHATLKSPRMCLELMTSYAPPYALRVITVSFGTVASQYA